MNRTTIQNLIVVCVLLVVVGGATVFSAFHISDLGRTLETHIYTLAEQSTQEASLLQLQRIAAESATDRSQLKGYFLTQESESLNFLNLVESIAPEAGIALETSALMRTTDRTTKADWAEATFNITGTKADIQRFIQILESLPYVSELTSVKLSVRSETYWQGEVTVRVRILPS